MQIQHQQAKHGGVFYLEQQQKRVGEISYQWRDQSSIIADHTWVDPSLRGQGAAKILLDALVAFAREKRLKIVPLCSYVEVMFRRDQSFADVAV